MDLAIGTRWSAPPLHPRAIPGVVDVWRADLGAKPGGLGELEGLLCAQERERAARIVRARDRMLWARSRGMLRALLGRYVDRDPRELALELGAHGKPALGDDDGHASDLRFNLSHSGGMMLVAVTAGREVGVDVEVVRDPARRTLDERAIAARVLGAEQARRLERLEPRERTREFQRAWTMREAAVKCLGTGLASAPVAGEGGGGSGGRIAALWTTELDAGPRAAAAVAVEGSEACESRCWDWWDWAG
jgi:4'-phosphopantetheinyl transferase